MGGRDREMGHSFRRLGTTLANLKIHWVAATSAAGVDPCVLMERGGISRVDRISLAGAFGSYISPWHAMVLGLIPDCDLSRVIAAGNAAGDGARIALLNRERRAESIHLARSVRYVSIAVEPRFQDEFVAAMALPHATDSFPHLSEVLPSRERTTFRERRRRRVGQPGEPAIQG